MSKLQLSAAIELGSMIVPRPWSMDVDRCAIGMALSANGVKPLRCDPILLLYSWLGKIFPCPWCDIECVQGVSLVAHPFGTHVLTGQITLDELCRWIASIEPDPRFYGIAEDMIQEEATPVLPIA